MENSPSPAGLAERSLRGDPLTREEASFILRWPEEDVLSLVQAAYRVRRAAFGKKVKLNFLVNIQSGLCPEDCGYCSQSKVSKAPVEKYRLMVPEEAAALAGRAVEMKASRVCLVASMRGPSERDLAAVEAAVRKVKETYPGLEVCASLGLLDDGQAERLKEAGLDVYNHNLNTSESRYGKICTTHAYADRLGTIERIKAGGMLTCSGVLFGMGETEEDVLDVAFAVRGLKAHAVPVNFLIPVPGTPLAGTHELTPVHCLRILALFRFLNPRAELRIAGGRELHLRSLQPLGLLIADSIFIGDYLTTEGGTPSGDVRMIRDLGFEILGEDFPPPPADLSSEVKILNAR
jgi:biotin synthase